MKKLFILLMFLMTMIAMADQKTSSYFSIITPDGSTEYYYCNCRGTVKVTSIDSKAVSCKNWVLLIQDGKTLCAKKIQ